MWYKAEIEKRIPGSEVRVYYGGGLYRVDEALEAMVVGNLEMTVMQPTKSAGFDPWLNIITQPLILTTKGAVNHFPETDVAVMLEDRLDAKGIKVVAWGHHSAFTGMGSTKRILTLDDLKGMKMRISAPLTQGPQLESFGASPVAMAYADVASALASGVVDGICTSTGGWLALRDLAPYYTVIGPGGALMDYYMICMSKKWLASLNDPTRKIVIDTMVECMEQEKLWCFAGDMLIAKQYGTTDPSKPGIYIATPEEQQPFKDAMGMSVVESMKTQLPSQAHPWIERFKEIGDEFVAKYPPGSDPIEASDWDTPENRDLLLPK